MYNYEDLQMSLRCSLMWHYIYYLCSCSFFSNQVTALVEVRCKCRLGRRLEAVDNPESKLYGRCIKCVVHQVVAVMHLCSCFPCVNRCTQTHKWRICCLNYYSVYSAGTRNKTDVDNVGFVGYGIPVLSSFECQITQCIAVHVPGVSGNTAPRAPHRNIVIMRSGAWRTRGRATSCTPGKDYLS